MAEHERREIRKMEREAHAKKKKKGEQTQKAQKVKDAAREAMIKAKVAKVRMAKAGDASITGKVCKADHASNDSQESHAEQRLGLIYLTT